mgnify:CR=1 FL=1
MNINFIVPPGTMASRGSPTGDSRFSLKHRFHSPRHGEHHYNKQRETHEMRKKLLSEFETVDTNRDGHISKAELNDFFESKGVDDFDKR